jgi:hypothetical protein
VAILAIEKVFPTPRGYKGCIRYALIKTKDGKYKVEKRRPFGWDSRAISQQEFDLCDTRKKAEKLWDYKNMRGTASWWGKEVIHPFFGLEFTCKDIENLRASLNEFAKGNGYKEQIK